MKFKERRRRFTSSIREDSALAEITWSQTSSTSLRFSPLCHHHQDSSGQGIYGSNFHLHHQLRRQWQVSVLVEIGRIRRGPTCLPGGEKLTYQIPRPPLLVTIAHCRWLDNYIWMKTHHEMLKIVLLLCRIKRQAII